MAVNALSPPDSTITWRASARRSADGRSCANAAALSPSQTQIITRHVRTITALLVRANLREGGGRR
jgi:hypothetical protein